MWLALLKNPLTKMIANKAIDHFKHKAEKVKTIRERKIKIGRFIIIKGGQVTNITKLEFLAVKFFLSC